MKVSSINTGLSGIQKGLEGINKAAQEIVSAANSTVTPEKDSSAGTGIVLQEPGPNLINSLIDLKINVQLVESSGKVVQATTNNLGFLLDVIA